MFKLRVFVADVRPSPTGVFAAFVDATYPAALATATGPIVHSLTYTFSQSGTSSSGQLNEVGGSDGLSPLGAGQFLVFEQAFMASATGDLTFASDRPDELPVHNNLVYGSNTAVPPGDIMEDSVTLTIAGDPGFLFDDSFEDNLATD